MKYARLGKTGLTVSRLTLGCMSFGTKEWQNWVEDEEQSFAVIKRAYDLGINFFDTADCYSNGESERILGRAIKKFNLPREKIVVASKCYFTSTSQSEQLKGVNVFAIDPDAHGFINQHGLSRKHIFDTVDASLERLGLDYIDLYQIHRWDYKTPIEETMRALHDVVQSGKVRYIGASSMYAWQFAKANHIAEKNGWTPFISMQNLYNLLYREEEREMIPYCIDAGIGLIPWSPLARGQLTGKGRDTTRNKTDAMLARFRNQQEEHDSKILDKVEELAKAKGVSMAQIAVAWLLAKPGVISPIIGVGKVRHLEDLVSAMEVKLTETEIKSLEEAYQTRAVFAI